MSTNHYTSRLFSIALILLSLGAGAFGDWRSTQDCLPEGLNMGNGRVDEDDKVLKGQLLAQQNTSNAAVIPAQAQVNAVKAAIGAVQADY